MSRYKSYIDTDVVTEARKRIHHIYDLFDTVVVMFSGGKDSLVTMNLVHEVAMERGLATVDVVFRDEEVIQQSVIDFVLEYRAKPWVKMLYFAVPLYSKKYILGRTFQYVQWDPKRRWVRAKPDFAITLPEGDERIFDQYTMDYFTAQYYHGKKAFVTGVRADESLTRYRSVVNKLSENYICKPMVSQKGQQDTPDVKICKPIYDMSEADIFKYLWENDIKYCPTYDAQLFAGAGLRVATPLLAEGARRFCKLKTYEPTLYKQVIDIFPEMLAHERYFLDLDTRAIKEQYGQSIEGVRTWILENLTDEHEQAIALQRLDGIEGLHRNDPAAYSTKHILNYFMGGGYKRLIMPERTGGKHG